MGETPVNMFGGSPLNRLSWLRPSHSFLNAVIGSPATRWILFNSGQPLVVAGRNSTAKPTLAYLATKDVAPFLGATPYFGQGQNQGHLASSEEGSSSHMEAARHHNSPIVFLGLREPTLGSGNALPSSDFKEPEAAVANLEGTPYFSIDVAGLDLEPENIDHVLKNTTPGREGQALSWIEPRTLISGLDQFSGGVFAEAKSLVDWNQRNKFCPACGSRTYSMWGGWKIACSSLLPWADNSARKPCPTMKGLHNFTHPRTDAVVIMIAIDETGDRVLLGRGKKFPGKFYSALAGFIEPGESFEDAVAREMWEEAGVRVWNVKYHSGQPWPYPANLMVGFYARADSSQVIRTDLDNELVDARWFTREEVAAVLRHPIGTTLGRADYKKMSDSDEGRTDTASDPVARQTKVPAEPAPGVNAEEPPFRLPPTTAIAGVLIRDWVDGKIGFPKESETVAQRGNL